MAENKTIVESIKIGTLEKQIEILEKIGINTNLIYDLQGQITAENTDTLDMILRQFGKILEQDELKTVEELARTLLANQSEASVKYVLQHKLIGDVFKHILKADNENFNGATLADVIVDNKMMDEVSLNKELSYVLFNSAYFVKQINDTNEASTICGSNEIVLKSVSEHKYPMMQLKNNSQFITGILNKPNTAAIFAKSKYVYAVIGTDEFNKAINTNTALNSIVAELDTLDALVSHDGFVKAVAHSEMWFNELKQSKYSDTILSKPSAYILGEKNKKWGTLFATKNGGWLSKLVDGTNKFSNVYSWEFVKTMREVQGDYKERSSSDNFVISDTSGVMLYNAHGGWELDPIAVVVDKMSGQKGVKIQADNVSAFKTHGATNELHRTVKTDGIGNRRYHIYYYIWKEMV